MEFYLHHSMMIYPISWGMQIQFLPTDRYMIFLKTKKNSYKKARQGETHSKKTICKESGNN